MQAKLIRIFFKSGILIKRRNLNTFLYIIFLLFCLSLNAELRADSFKLLLVTDKTATASQQISYNLGKALSDASVGFEILDREDIPAFTADRLKDYRAVVFMAEKVSGYVFADDLLKYVVDGGVVCVAMHDFNNEWLQLAGIQTAEPGILTYEEANGFKSIGPVLKDIQLDVPADQFSTTALDLVFSEAWRIMMRFHEPELPMLAERDLGKGKLVFWNTSSLSQKSMRGLFLFSIFRQFDIAAFSVLNTFLFHLDDSPPPGYGIKEGPVARDLKMTDQQFYLNVWQKSFLPMLEEFGITPTHFMCLRYDAIMKAPFPEEIDREPFFSRFLKELQKRGHELAFHGYNHQSLTLGASPATPWSAAEDMKASNEAAYKIWQKYFLPPTLTYVPPNNVVDKAGKQAVLEGFPTIRVFSRLYEDSGEYRPVQRSGFLIGAGDNNFNDEIMKNLFSMYASRRAKSGNSPAMMFAGDEFGFDPEVPQILNLPRLSSGHTPDGFMRLQMLNGIMAHGAIIHFLHPDDIYDPSRREETWEKTLMAARRTLRFFEQAGGHLAKTTTGRYLRNFRQYVLARTSVEMSGQQLEIDPKGRHYYYLFVREGSKLSLNGAEIVKEIEPGRLFLIRASQKASISLK